MQACNLYACEMCLDCYKTQVDDRAVLLSLLSLLLDHEDGADNFLRNVRSLPNYTALKFRRPYCEYLLL
jgi:hypothetical protein